MAGGPGNRGRPVGLAFADLIDTQIRTRGLTNSQVAKGIRRCSLNHKGDDHGATETTAETVSRWRNGHQIPESYHLHLVAEYFELSLRELVSLVQTQQAILAAVRIRACRSPPGGVPGLPAEDSEARKPRAGADTPAPS